MDTITTASACVAGLGVISLVAFQSDAVGRRWLAPDRLQTKRHAEYAYRWSQAVEKHALALSYSWWAAAAAAAGEGAGGGDGVSSSTVDAYDADEELLQTTVFTTDDEVKEFVNKIVSSSSSFSTTGDDSFDPRELRIGKIAKDTRMMNSNEYYVWLYYCNSQKSNSNSNITKNQLFPMFQLPLSKFGLFLADELERTVSKTTFCFVADASAGLAVDTLAGMLDASASCSEQQHDEQKQQQQKQQQQQQDAVSIIREPAWMVDLARLMQQRLYSTDKIERMLFALCRLQALASCSKKMQIKTAVITIPQAIVPVLLPVVIRVFPDDRHVFAYSTCFQAVQEANYRRSAERRGVIPNFNDKAFQFHDAVSVTTPFSKKSLHFMSPFISQSSKAFCTTLADLPVQTASAVESWMAAVDTFLNLKEEEKTNGYLPYVMRFDYFVVSESSSSSISTDVYWMARSLLQYVTGSRTRPLSERKLGAALKWLQQEQQQQQHVTSNTATTPAATAAAIDKVVFTHKRILIPTKTLLDTVQPVEHWTLKQATKKGCACCAPEDEDEDDDEQDDNFVTADNDGANGFEMIGMRRDDESPGYPMLNVPQRRKGGTVQSNGYVDGKTTFAFDPTRFS